MRLTTRVRYAAVAAVAAVAALAPAGLAQAANSHALITGTGSSWAANAVNQWTADVQANGLQVVFTSNGSAQGRKDFAASANDFGVSDIGFQGKDPVTGQSDDSGGRSYAYLPIVGGGTAFPYHLIVAGKQIRTLRLSGLTLAKIFTNQITDWSDAAITKDNNGIQLPQIPIVPVVHSEGSGSTAMFTRYLATEFPTLWQNYSGQSGMVEYYPRKGQQIAQDGSDGIMNYITSAAGNGTIGFDEYSYASTINYPVAKIENTAGFFTLPNQYNVAVALTQAQINMDKTSKDYLLQNLDNVYTYNDARAYPLSSYSYAIIPTGSADKRMTTPKRQTLADFLAYSLCQGQKEMGPIGYSPLPINLVQASFNQTTLLAQADSGVDVSLQDVTKCHNPTFDPTNPSRNYLAEIAPQPAACDQSGQGPCGATTDTGTANPGSGGSAPPAAGGSPAATAGASAGAGKTPGAGPASTKSASAAHASGRSGSGTASSSTAATAAASAQASASVHTHVDPVTGQVVTDAPTAAQAGVVTDQSAQQPVSYTNLANQQDTSSQSFYTVLVLALLALVLVAPATLAISLRRKRSGR